MPKSQKNINTTEPEISGAGIEYSNAKENQSGGSSAASAAV